MKVTRSFKIDEKDDKELKNIANEMKIPISNLIRNIIINYLEFVKEDRK
ncbi:ribbon-helix-helix domain-containing protein [Methanobrevibacter filiformis]|uniref:Ribbon-helix-helix domain protein n=1 Tax=Methanobrevibacter filiformis TaxID=55758 RepID=A0A165ZNH4_9EURY|nr:ribbon-helix-helix domain-containing protein [Methanobrevibacter filiformis]KZX10946.1 ribbon-helix-helix domain protein [Methanobrevibacter filiformis]